MPLLIPPLWSAWEEDSFGGLIVEFSGYKSLTHILCGGNKYNPSSLAGHVDSLSPLFPKLLGIRAC